MIRNFWPILVIFVLLYYIVTFNLFFFHLLDLFTFHMHIFLSNQLIESSFELKAILLISSVKTLCFSLLNLGCIFNINLLFFYEFFMAYFKVMYIVSFFLNGLSYFQVELLPNSFYNLQM